MKGTNGSEVEFHVPNKSTTPPTLQLFLFLLFLALPFGPMRTDVLTPNHPRRTLGRLRESNAQPTLGLHKSQCVHLICPSFCVRTPCWVGSFLAIGIAHTGCCFVYTLQLPRRAIALIKRMHSSPTGRCLVPCQTLLS